MKCVEFHGFVVKFGHPQDSHKSGEKEFGGGGGPCRSVLWAIIYPAGLTPLYFRSIWSFLTKRLTFGPKRGSKLISSNLLMVRASEYKHIEASPQKIGNTNLCNFFFAINT